MTIPLEQVLPLEDLTPYKVHLASWNGENQPLDVFVRDRTEWGWWNTWRDSRNDFNRRYIFSLIDFYGERNIWLFGGIYKVLERHNKDFSHSYKVALTEQAEDLIGRLKVHFKRPGRQRVVTLTRYAQDMSVSEVLKEPYSGERFPGYERINHEFSEIESIIRSQKPDWKAALENVKGVYAIFDNSNGLKYVGAAYGDTGVWSRWGSYIRSGHGGNDELIKLIQSQGLSYARQNFRIVLLECYFATTGDETIIEREAFWKKALMSRGQFGYNKN